MMHAVVLYSVGSPEHANAECLKSYLNNFLSDKLVVKMPRFLWQPILRSFILRSRPERMVPRYKQIFVDDANPYLISMGRLEYKLECALNDNCHESSEEETIASIALGSAPKQQSKAKVQPLSEAEATTSSSDRYIVKTAFAYSGKGLEDTVQDCVNAGVKKITVVPLFPQYSDTTTKRPYLILQNLKQLYPDVSFVMVRSFANSQAYIEAICQSIEPVLNELLFSIKRKNDGEDINAVMKRGKAHVLITYHSLPQSYIKLGDPYLTEVEMSTKGITSALGLDEHNISVAFQSKMGPMSWLKPDIDDELKRLLDAGITRLLVIAPGFSIDCLETLYDININLRERFLSLGGDSFLYVPALNHSKGHIKLLKTLVHNNATAI